MSEVTSKARIKREARDLRRLNAVVDGLWLLDTVGAGTEFKEKFTPFDAASERVHGELVGFSALASRFVTYTEWVLGDDRAELAGFRMHQLTVLAVRWYDDMIAEIAPVMVPHQVQAALIAGATYQLALAKTEQKALNLDSVVQHVFGLCFNFEASQVVTTEDDL